MILKTYGRRGLGLLLLFFYIQFLPVSSYSRGLSSNKIKKHVQTILNFGPRPSGSANLKKTQNYIIRHLKAQGWEVQVSSFFDKTPLGKTAFKNILALPKKHERLKKLWVLAVHYESKYFNDFAFSGANDNTAGVGLLMAMAKILKKKFQNLPVALLFLDGEEAFVKWSKSDSLYGSRYQAKLWTANGFSKKVKGLILLDMIGDKKPRFCREENSSEWLVDEIWKSARKNGLSHFFKNCSVRISDDHLPFIAEGISAVDIIHYPFPSYWHTRHDTIDKLSFQNLAQIGNFLLAFIRRN